MSSAMCGVRGGTRREFIRASGVVAGGLSLLHGSRVLAAPFGLPIGLQLYSVRELLPKDFAGTLKQIGALGYGEVEAAGFYGHSASEVRAALDAAGLKCPSAHYGYNDLNRDFEKILVFHQELGAETVVCASPGFKDPDKPRESSNEGHARRVTLEDWRWNAERFNTLGAKAKAAGLRFGYHNHTMEFQAQDGVVPYDELVRLTDPALVTMELDCGWVMVGGGNAVDYLTRYPTRISMLHVKDFKKPEKALKVLEAPEAAELGRGTADYAAIFGAARKAGVRLKHCFVEQESFDGPPMEALGVDAAYMRGLKG